MYYRTYIVGGKEGFMKMMLFTGWKMIDFAGMTLYNLYTTATSPWERSYVNG